VIAVVGVNYAFTEPYFQFNFTITGYPLTFLAMLAVAVSVSALMTQIKRQEQIKLDMEREKMRGNLLRAVSHDIRTPLTSIVGSASTVLEHYEALTDDKKIELTRDIKEEAQGLVRIVVKVNILDEVLLVPMDAILIEQVLVNLLENSALHGKTTGTVEISVLKQKTDVLFMIEDDGQGIREDILPVIFEGGLHENEMEEADSRRNMGIGLSVCMSIIKAHEGNMRAENKAGGGARMLFSLPLGKEL
jgi:two-component system sensor histidine kinase KdpD